MLFSWLLEGLGVLKMSRVSCRVLSGSVRTCTGRLRPSQALFESPGSGRVGSGRRVGTGRVRSGGEEVNILGRVRSRQEVKKAQGSGLVMTRENRVTRGLGQHDPRVILG